MFIILLVFLFIQSWSQPFNMNTIPTWMPQCRNSPNGTEQYLEVYLNRNNLYVINSTTTTEMFTYGCNAINPITNVSLGIVYSSPGPTIKATSGVPLNIKYIVQITGNHLFPIDYTMMMDPNAVINTNLITQVPAVVHVHGIMVPSTSDGFPSGYTTSNGIQGPSYTTEVATNNNSFVYRYPNLQQQATLMYHDHTIGLTRLNVQAGWYGFYIIQPSSPTTPLSVVDPAHDIKLVIADRTFLANGSLSYPGSWVPEYYADNFVVNGKVWPNMTVQQGLYRLRLLNLCNSRMLRVSFVSGNLTLMFRVIKADANYLDASYQTDYLIMFPSERYEILIDFSNLDITTINMQNSYIPDYPDSDPLLNQSSIGPIMTFLATQNYTANFTVTLPQSSRNTITSVDQIRNIILVQKLDSNQNPLMSLINGHDFSVRDRAFQIGKSYQLRFINLTPDPHPIHIHLTQFQVMKRLSFDKDTYRTVYISQNELPLMQVSNNTIDYTPYLTGNVSLPDSWERGFKDTLRVLPYMVTIAYVRFLQPSLQQYNFDASKGPGYMLHCHILEHEDNSMMISFQMTNRLVSNNSSLLSAGPISGIVIAAVFAIGLVIFLCVYFRKRNVPQDDKNNQNDNNLSKSHRQTIKVSSTDFIDGKDLETEVTKNQRAV